MENARQLNMEFTTFIVPTVRPKIIFKTEVEPMKVETPKKPKVRDDVRVCECCQEQKPLNRDYFHISSRDGDKIYFRRKCKVCAAKEAKAKKKAELKVAKTKQKVVVPPSPIVTALDEAKKCAARAWDDYQMARDLFNKNIVTDKSYRRRKLSIFIEAQKTVQLIESAANEVLLRQYSLSGKPLS